MGWYLELFIWLFITVGVFSFLWYFTFQSGALWAQETGRDPTGRDRKAWGWKALLLPWVGYRALIWQIRRLLTKPQ
jgi:hypothetical protein